MKTYILKYPVHNEHEFPIGTIVTITDDYWGNGNEELNTGFTVVEDGPMKGMKGCVADGLNGYLLENTPENHWEVRDFFSRKAELNRQIEKLNQEWDQLETAKL